MKKRYFSVTMALFLYAFSAAAEVVFHDLQDKAIPLSSLKGKWVLINYWASWCHPCLEEIPELNRFYDMNKSGDVVMFGVNYDGLPIPAQEKLIKQLDIHYPLLKGDPASELNLGDIRGVPVTFVISPEGELVDMLYGEQTARSLGQRLSAKG